MLAGMAPYRNRTVLGIALDGHMVYGSVSLVLIFLVWFLCLRVEMILGPYNDSGSLITSGYDVCNGTSSSTTLPLCVTVFAVCVGMFIDADNYGYITANTMPYLLSCFGPAGFPCFTPTCSTNPVANFTRGPFVPAGSCYRTSGAGSVGMTFKSKIMIAIHVN